MFKRVTIFCYHCVQKPVIYSRFAWPLDFLTCLKVMQGFACRSQYFAILLGWKGLTLPTTRAKVLLPYAFLFDEVHSDFCSRAGISYSCQAADFHLANKTWGFERELQKIHRFLFCWIFHQVGIWKNKTEKDFSVRPRCVFDLYSDIKAYRGHKRAENEWQNQGWWI